MNTGNWFSLEGKVALITGAAYGIGFAIAQAYAAAGATICFNCRSEQHKRQRQQEIGLVPPKKAAWRPVASSFHARQLLSGLKASHVFVRQ